MWISITATCWLFLVVVFFYCSLHVFIPVTLLSHPFISCPHFTLTAIRGNSPHKSNRWQLKKLAEVLNVLLYNFKKELVQIWTLGRAVIDDAISILLHITVNISSQTAVILNIDLWSIPCVAPSWNSYVALNFSRYTLHPLAMKKTGYLKVLHLALFLDCHFLFNAPTFWFSLEKWKQLFADNMKMRKCEQMYLKCQDI